MQKSTSILLYLLFIFILYLILPSTSISTDIKMRYSNNMEEYKNIPLTEDAEEANQIANRIFAEYKKLSTDKSDFMHPLQLFTQPWRNKTVLFVVDIVKEDSQAHLLEIIRKIAIDIAQKPIEIRFYKRTSSQEMYSGLPPKLSEDTLISTKVVNFRKDVKDGVGPR